LTLDFDGQLTLHSQVTSRTFSSCFRAHALSQAAFVLILWLGVLKGWFLSSSAQNFCDSAHFSVVASTSASKVCGFNAFLTDLRYRSVCGHTSILGCGKRDGLCSALLILGSGG